MTEGSARSDVCMCCEPTESNRIDQHRSLPWSERSILEWLGLLLFLFLFVLFYFVARALHCLAWFEYDMTVSKLARCPSKYIYTFIYYYYYSFKISNQFNRQVGEEAEQTNHQKQIDSTKALDELLKSGKASESEIYAKIEEYKEKFADYGRDRRSAMEFHLRNVERLLMPTQTTNFMMNMMKDSDNSGSVAPAESAPPPPPPVLATPMDIVPPFPEAVVSRKYPKTSKELFTLLVKKLEVTPVQAAALKDSRFVAQEMDETLKETFNVLKELRGRMAQCGQDLETEFNCIRQILTPSQSAKFLVWVAQNKACMHMLNELWSKNYPSMMTSTTGSPPTTPTGSGSFDE
jgi:hypothetical protein